MKKNLKCMECVWSEGRSPSHSGRSPPNTTNFGGCEALRTRSAGSQLLSRPREVWVIQC